MINEKYKWPISIASLILSLIFMVSLIQVNLNNKSVKQKTLAAVLDKESITEFNIDISDENWNWLLENPLEEEYRSADITINGEIFYNVGIRPKGNSTLTTVASDETTDRYSFKVKFDKYVEGQSYHGIDTIVLNNNIQDTTYMKEYISYDLFDFMGVATPEMSYADLKLNGETWGLYLAIEVIEERYLENNFGTTEGNLYKPETMAMGKKDGNGGGPGGNPPEMPEGFDPENMPERFNPEAIENGDIDTQEQERNEENGDNRAKSNKKDGGMGGHGGPGSNRNNEGADFKYIDDDVSSYSIVRDSAVFKRTTDRDFKKVINMFKNLNDGTNLEEVLDVEEVLKYFAVNTYLTNFDSYSGAMYHNYYLYENNGRCQILPWDFNLSFGGFSQGGGPGQKNNNSGSAGANNMINFPIDKAVTGELENAPLIGKLLEVDEYKELYHSYLKQIAEEYFESGYYADLVNKIDNMINDYVKNDPTAFYGYEKYTAAIPNLILWGEDRTKSVVAQLNGEQPSTEYGNIESNVDMDALTEMGRGGPGKGGKEGNIGPRQGINQEENMPQDSEKPSEQNSKQVLEDDYKTEELKNNETKKDENNRDNSLLDMAKGNSDNKKAYMKNIMILSGYFLLAVAGLVFAVKFRRR